MEKKSAKPRPFLTAEWRYVLMLNYEVDPAVLLPLMPAGMALDLWQGRALVSVVGFLFQKTRLRGIPVPFHTHFEEVNLRFYVRPAGDSGGERRGVVFVKEIVPLAPVAKVARWLYRENYVSMPMRHTIEEKGGATAGGVDCRCLPQAPWWNMPGAVRAVSTGWAGWLPANLSCRCLGLRTNSSPSIIGDIRA